MNCIFSVLLLWLAKLGCIHPSLAQLAPQRVQADRARVQVSLKKNLKMRLRGTLKKFFKEGTCTFWGDSLITHHPSPGGPIVDPTQVLSGTNLLLFKFLFHVLLRDTKMMTLWCWSGKIWGKDKRRDAYAWRTTMGLRITLQGWIMRPFAQTNARMMQIRLGSALAETRRQHNSLRLGNSFWGMEGTLASDECYLFGMEITLQK